MKDITTETQEYRSYMRLSNFSKSTVDMYTRTLSIFLKFYNENYPDEDLNQDHAQQYLLQRIDSGKAWSTINADYSALRKYYKILKEYPWSLKKLPRPKKDKKLPAILSKEEVAKLIQCAPTFKHQVFLTFLYATGARLSEAINLKLIDIDSDRMQIHIHRGKGAKDRTVVLNKCSHQHYIYFSCGHSRCSICQAIKTRAVDGSYGQRTS